MSDQKPLIVDILGVEPVAKAIDRTVEGALNFLGVICMPAASEIGLWLQDTVRKWRGTNTLSVLSKAAEKAGKAPGHAHPHIVHEILDKASWTDDETIQDLWAGLLASSCTATGDDDSNLVFIRRLSSLTKVQARILNYACAHAEKSVMENGLLCTSKLLIGFQEFCRIAGESNIHRLDRELDDLRSLELIHGGCDPHGITTNILLHPTTFAVNLFVRCQGSRLSPVDFFGLQAPAPRKREATPVTDWISPSA